LFHSLQRHCCNWYGKQNELWQYV